jgi:GT2 family glycosyltransferase
VSGVENVVLPAPADPVVTIVVPAWRKVALLHRTLRTIARHVPAPARAETVVVVNGGDERVGALLERRVRGARVVPTEVNLGFGGACNLAAEVGGGRFLALLNDDVEIRPGWLEALLVAMEEEPGAASVGSRVLHPDGRLQEAGCVVWADGTTSQVGKDEAANGRHHLARRRVDYASGCALLVRRDAWESVGGMDPAYFPGYYEDVDLAFRLRERGWSTVYEPSARVLHEESASSDPVVKEVVLARNRETFRERWSETLARLEPREDSPEAMARAIERARGATQRLLLVAALSRADDRDRIRQLARSVRDQGFAVWLWPVDGHARGHALEVGRAGVEVVPEALAEHLGTPGVLYDVVAFDAGTAPAGVSELLSRFQPYAGRLALAGVLAAPQPGELLRQARRKALA